MDNRHDDDEQDAAMSQQAWLNVGLIIAGILLLWITEQT
jgi:hypothetical protein